MNISKENIPLTEVFVCFAGQRFNDYKNNINININTTRFWFEIHALNLLDIHLYILFRYSVSSQKLLFILFSKFYRVLLKTFQPSVPFYMETSHVIWFANEKTGFYR